MAFKPEVLVSGKWHQNALVFATREEAEQNAHDLFMRWTTCEDSRAVEVDQPATHSYRDRIVRHLDENGEEIDDGREEERRRHP